MKRTSRFSSRRPSREQTQNRLVAEVEKLLGQLVAANPRERELAAAYLGDLLEADQIHGKLLQSVVDDLTRRALMEENPDARETMFSALVDAGMRTRVACNSIADALACLDKACLEYALILLGWSGQLEYKGLISRYLQDSDETIRQTAAEAIGELDASQNARNGKL